MCKAVAFNLAEQDILVVNANYRLSPDVTYPAYVEDAARAFRWVKNRIATFGGNPQKVSVGGHSVGAYLSPLFGTDSKYVQSVDFSLADIAGMIPVCAQTYSHSIVQQEQGLTASFVKD